MKLFIIIIIVLIVLILYLVYLLYYKFTNDTINSVDVTTKLDEINKFNNNSIIENVNNIILTLKYKKSTFNIELELFDDKLPITCKNFRHIAFTGIKNKTYKNTKFYNILDNGSLEGGDILNNDGTGIISLYGKYFIDESFKYNHSVPGLLSLVSEGTNKNTSKFMITTKCCPSLDGKQVVFGRVVSGLYHLFDLVKNSDANSNPINDIEIIDIV